MACMILNGAVEKLS